MQTTQFSQQTDAHLVSEYISGDEKSLEILIYKHKSRIYNFIFSTYHEPKTTEKDIEKSTFLVFDLL